MTPARSWHKFGVEKLLRGNREQWVPWWDQVPWQVLDLPAQQLAADEQELGWLAATVEATAASGLFDEIIKQNQEILNLRVQSVAADLGQVDIDVTVNPFSDIFVAREGDVSEAAFCVSRRIDMIILDAARRSDAAVVATFSG